MRLLADQTSAPSIRESLDAEPSKVDCDARKEGSRAMLVREGRERKARISRKIDDALRKLCIIRAPEMSFAMRDYECLLKAHYERLLRQTSGAACRSLVRGRPVADQDVLQFIKAGSVQEQGSTHVKYVVLPSGEQSVQGEHIVNTIAEYFITHKLRVFVHQ